MNAWCISFATIGAILSLTDGLTNGYRPVILMHGVQFLLGPKGLSGLANFIKDAHPGTVVTNVDAFTGMESIYNSMDNQVEGVWEIMKPIVDNATDGVDMICYSQGGLICRAILERFAVPVKSFITLSSPLAGQYGDTQFINHVLPTYTRAIIYKVLYTKKAQESISFAGYWNDPSHQELYYQYCTFLPLLNNGSAIYKENFLRVQHLILIGGPDDGVITPWESSQFGFYAANNKSLLVIPYNSQTFYANDSFGLKTLDMQGRLKLCTEPGVVHLGWPTSRDVFERCILPYLSV